MITGITIRRRSSIKPPGSFSRSTNFKATLNTRSTSGSNKEPFMPKLLFRVVVIVLCLAALLTGTQPRAALSSSPVNDYKAQVVADVAAMAKQSQVMVDMVFSFGELGFQEIETSKYLAGIPTAWIASWGTGKPVIALGSDVDCIPQASQKPGVAYHDPLIEGAPGHGEGHNSGVPLNITAAIAVKRLMEK